MKILVIKQTSLGDVLHATGHIRQIKEQFPQAELHVMTATSSAMLLQNHPSIDKLILIDRYAFKRNWWRKPLWAYGLIRDAINAIQAHEYDLAIDLQGLTKSVVFLYAAHAKEKFVKGKWPFLQGFHNRSLHAIRELDEVLKVAGVAVNDTSMSLHSSGADHDHAKQVLDEVNPRGLPLLVFSAYSRWQSKDWPLENYVALARYFTDDYLVIFTGADNRKPELDSAVAQVGHANCVSLAGRLSLTEFAALVGHARLTVTGDSFPMHVSVAKDTPVIAVFGPTDPRKVGPIGKSHRVIQAADCRQCEKADCRRLCLYDVEVGVVQEAVENALNRLQSSLPG